MEDGWRPWRALRGRPEVEFALVDLPDGMRAVLCQRDGDTAILVDRKLPPAERLAALTHELVHLERGGSGHHPELPAPMRPLIGREERRVDDITATRILPLDRLRSFVESRVEVEPITAHLVAEHFDVAESVAKRALDLLRRSA